MIILILIMLLGFCIIGIAFIYYYMMGIRFINRKFRYNIPLLIFAYIFFIITSLPLILIYSIILLMDSFKNIKMLKTMAYDKNVKIEVFMDNFEKYAWLMNIEDRRTLPDKAFYVRNSK